MAIVHATKANFDEMVLKSQKTVLLDFWATWCMPCKMLSPILEEIAQERQDVIVAKVNIDEEMDLATQFKITSIPTLILMKGGKAAGVSVGLISKDEVLKFIDQA